MKRKVVVPMILVMLLSFGTMTHATEPETLESEEAVEYATGCIPASDEELNQIPVAPILATGVTLPAKWDFSDKFPQPGNQGSQGSCVAWAVGYAYKGYQEGVERFWQHDSLDKLFSPAFIYNRRQIKYSADNKKVDGMPIVEALDMVIKDGVCTMKEMPYNPATDQTQPTAEAFREAKSFRAMKQYRLKAQGSQSIIGITKSHLCTNTPVIISMPVFPEIHLVGRDGNYVYNHKETPNDSTNIAYHAVVLTGYDDDLQAFKFINSWGTNWGLEVMDL